MMLRASPGPRYSSVMARYDSRLILFGGGGSYIPSIKTRQCFNDVRQFDTIDRQWLKDQRMLKGNYVPERRMHHKGDILGCILAVYGGFNTENKTVLNDLILYDIADNSWVTAVVKYPNGDKKIGPRTEHSMTSLNNCSSNVYYDIRW